MDYIDALRGAACLWVVLHHLLGSYVVGPGLVHLPLRLLVKGATIGWLGVSLFLVLSGFCLYYPLVRGDVPRADHVDLKKFFKRRAWRILPPYYATLIVFFLLAFRHTYFDKAPLKSDYQGWWNVLSHLFMLHNLTPSTIFTINGVFWSLALESQLYLLFPLFVFVAARWGFKAVIIPTLCLAVVWQSAVFWHFGLGIEWSEQLAVWYHALPGRCFEFAAGMATAAFVAAPKPHTNRYAAFVGTLLVVPALYYALFIARAGPLLDQMWGMVFCCLIIVLHQVPHGYFRSNFLLRGLTWVGTISYSLYLTHNLVFQRASLPPHNDAFVLIKALVYIGLAIGVAAIFFWCFERPFIVRKNATEAEVIQATALSPAP